jgi:predicted ABC-type transport system involved in lysophospholipase L1 biosynthesis ATPase subunit
LLPTMTAMENVMVPMVMAGLMSSKERHARARELLGRVGMSECVRPPATRSHFIER